MRVDFDPFHPDVIADPYPALAALRRHDPVHWSERLNGWVLTRHEDVRLGLRDPRFSADRMRPFFAHLLPDERETLQALEQHLTLWSVFADPPRHTRLRGLMNRAFTSRALAAMQPRIAALVGELLDAVAPRGEMDLIADFAYPLPAMVIAELMGVPRSDVGLLKRWSDQLSRFVFSARLAPDKYRAAAGGMTEMTDYFRRLVERRRRQPGSDVTSGLVQAEERGQFLGPDELVAACALLLFAGHETTTQLIGNGVLALLAHPDQMALLGARRDDPAAVAAAVEELLRWDGPSLAFVRVMAADVPLGGRTLRTGDRVFLMIAAANRDPQVFPDPDRLDLLRADNPHLAFGFGIHFCLGAPLARMEGQAAFPQLLGRCRDIALRDPPPRWSDSLVIRSVDRIGLGFRRAGS